MYVLKLYQNNEIITVEKQQLLIEEMLKNGGGFTYKKLWNCPIFSQPYEQSHLCYSVASVIVVCDVMYRLWLNGAS